MSQDHVAAKAKLSKRALVNYERGTVSPKVKTLEALLTLYGITTLQEYAERAGTKVNPTVEEVNEVRESANRVGVYGRNSAVYRELAEILERIERLEDVSRKGS